MYRQTKFSEILYRIREQLSQEAEFDALKLARLLLEGNTSTPLHKTKANKESLRNAKAQNENEDLDLIYGKHL